MTVTLGRDSRGYIRAAMDGFALQGWSAKILSSRGHLRTNRQLITLEYGGTAEHLRLLIFKIGESGRSNPNERRIEVTSTYVGTRQLPRLEGIDDVLLGYDPNERVFVGFDTRRLEHGGPSQNASAFIDASDLSRVGKNGIRVVPRDSELFGTESHAYFKAQFMDEYVTNRTVIHSGSYTGGGTFSGGRISRRKTPLLSVADIDATGDVVILRAPDMQREPPPIDKQLLNEIESEGPKAIAKRVMSPETLQRLLLAAANNGQLGERHVLEEERRRLSASGRRDLSARVAWTSQQNVGAGYDIRSFEVDGSDRLIEVKSTSGTSKRFFISRNEWATARHHGTRYWIYRVTKVGSRRPLIATFQDPVELLDAGKLKRDPTEWVMWPAR